jgi:hypothetical protein
MKTGVEQIAQERQEQIEKHGFTVAKDILENNETELSYFAGLLCHSNCAEANAIAYLPPKWRKDKKELCLKMIRKSYKERLVIAGALIAAEIDRIQKLT